MSVRSQKIVIYRILVISLISFGIADCSNSIDSSAPISSIKKCNLIPDELNGTTVIPVPKVPSNNTPRKTNITTIPSPVSILQSRLHHPNLTKKINFSDYENVKNNRTTCYRNYKYIPRGSYRDGNTYTVKNGDTLFYISWITGNDFHELAQLNNIQAPYDLNSGKILQLRSHEDVASKKRDLKFIPIKKKEITSKKESIHSKNISEKKTNKKVLSDYKQSTKTITSPITSSIVSSSKLISNDIHQKEPIFAWNWPTKRGSIETPPFFTDGGSQGINILGHRGQEIVAAADGHVVYAGNALRGYGNLIIIKHNKDYLSAYAHNDAILVREKQKVRAGQKIATMGSSGTNSTCLHFEIRYRGKSVNPLQYLPKK